MQCATHPSVETELACGKCEKPICPKCLIQTPVGARCRECANLRKLPQFEISLSYYARAIGAALVSGGVLGLVWGFLLGDARLGLLFAALVGLGVGYVVGEAVSIAVNRKFGVPLQAIAGGGVVLAYALGNVIGGVDNWVIGFDDLLVVGIGIFVAAGRLRLG